MKVTKPWGNYNLFTKNEKTTVKIISLDAGHRTSLQFHRYRTEKWFVIKGTGIAHLLTKHDLKPGVELVIPKTKPHRLEAVTDLSVLEISYGKFDESDIVRLDDDYCRTIKKI